MITFKKISDYNFMKVRGSMCGEVEERENYSRLKDTKKTWYINTHTHTHTHTYGSFIDVSLFWLNNL